MRALKADQASAFRFFLMTLLLALALAGCTTQFAPPGPYSAGEGPPPELLTAAMPSEGTFRADDGLLLPWRAWLPVGEPQAVVLALHGMNDYAEAFALPGTALAAAGIAVYAYDQRGFGAAPHRGLWPGTDRLVADLRDATALLAARHPGLPLYLLGESMGGAVVIAATTRPGAPQVAGIILSAPAVWGYDEMGLVPRVSLWVARRLVPGMTATGSDLKIQATDNLPLLQAFSTDPLVIKKTRIDAVGGLVDLMDEALLAAPKLTARTLLLYGDKDQVIPADSLDRFWTNLPAEASGRQRRLDYPGGWHWLLRDLQAARVYADIAAWIADPDQPLPSVTDNSARERGKGAS